MSVTNLVSVNADDWKRIKALRLRAVNEQPYAFSPTPEESEAQDESVWRPRLEKDTYVFAEQDDVLVGMAALVPQEGEKNRHVAYIYSVYVAPEVRGQGVGKMIMQAIERKALAQEHVIKLQLDVSATQDSAIHLYESLGFERTGVSHRQINVNGKFADEVHMEKFIR